MATYQDIKGLRVKYLSADPGTLRAGDVWYNSTSGTLKGVVNIAAWSSGASMNTARRGLAGMGTQAASLGAGGYIGPTVSYNNDTEEYNGSGWAIGGNIGTARDMMAACGTQTAGLIAGGRNATTANGLSEEYNGTGWTEGSNLNTDRGGLLQNGAGTQTAGLAAGGFTGPSGTKTGATEEYNGASWTTSPGSLSTARSAGALFGIQTAAVAATGEAPPNSPAVEEYDGSTWTAGTVVPSPAATQECSSFGTATDGVMVGGTEEENLTLGYDGTTWTSLPNLATGRYAAGAAGTTPAGILFGGAGTPPLQTDVTEEFNKSINTVTAATWASITAYPTTATSISGVGSSTAGLFFGGEGPGGVITTSVTYDGSAWTAASAKGSASQLTMNFGTQASAVSAGGEPIPGIGTQVEEWGGSSWSTAPNTISDGRRNGAGSGASEPSGVIFGGGEHPSYSTSCEEYDGTSWTEGGDLPNGRAGVGAGDSATAALYFGGSQNPSPPYVSNVSQEYNGTAWTNTPNMLTQRRIGPTGPSTGANSTAGAFYSGGLDGPGTVLSSVEAYNGSAWTTSPSLASAIYSHGGNGSTSGAVIAGGNAPSITNAAQELTAESSVATASTLTTS